MRTILVINDAPEFLDLMRDFLREEGYAPHTHTDGECIPALIRQVQPALIVLDLVLGDTDGRAVLTELRADERARDIPVIVCSAASERVRRHAATLHDDRIRVLEKPFDLDHLLALIVELIGTPAGTLAADGAGMAGGAPAMPGGLGRGAPNRRDARG